MVLNKWCVWYAFEVWLLKYQILHGVLKFEKMLRNKSVAIFYTYKRWKSNPRYYIYIPNFHRIRKKNRPQFLFHTNQFFPQMLCICIIDYCQTQFITFTFLVLVAQCVPRSFWEFANDPTCFLAPPLPLKDLVEQKKMSSLAPSDM